MTLAVVCVYAGILAALAALWKLVAGDPGLERSAWWILLAVELAVGGAAAAILGAGALRRSLAGLPPARSWWWGPLAGGVTFAASWLYIAGLLFALGEEVEPQPRSLVLVLEMVVLAPLVEEWLCRGVLWDALRRVSSPRATLALTSLLFALLHCIGGLVGFPHRFVAGLAFGWLRHRTGSLLPGIAAHAVHNALVTAIV